MDCRVHGVAESQRRLSNFHFPIFQSLLFYLIRSVSEFEKESMADSQRPRRGVTWLLDSGPWIWHWPRDKGSLGSSRGQRPPSSKSGRGMKTLRTRWERGDLAPVSCRGLQVKQTPNPAHQTLERIWTETTQLRERRRLSRGPGSCFSSTSNSAHIKCETPEGMPRSVKPIGFRSPSRQGEEQWHVQFSLAFILANSPQENL